MPETTKKTFKKGEFLIRAGERGDCAYIIENGNVEILVQQEGQLIRIGTRGAGSLLGEMAMIDDLPRTATVRALDACDVMEISRAEFTRRVESADPVITMVMHVIMTRYRDLMSKTQFVSFMPDKAGPLAAETAENTNAAHDMALSALKIHSELKAAIEKKELTLHYQPIINMDNGSIAGFEALMRWKHAEKGMISPGIFIPVAEETGLITEMTQWALETACDDVKNFAARRSAPLFVSVNFSVKDFATGRVFEQISETLDKKSVQPSQVHIEITESLLMQAPGDAKTALEKCRARGLSVSIDDFGSGYSSLSYLHSFPIDTLKIDQSFIRAMTTHDASRVLVKSIIGLAKNLNMDVVAEGIESVEEANILHNFGCDFCQGYWFARPMPHADAADLLKSWQPRQFDRRK